MGRSVIVLGSGGHAKVVLATLRAMDADVRGWVGPEGVPEADLLGVPRLGDDAWLVALGPVGQILANGVGSIGVPERRRALFVDLSARGFEFATLLHPSATVASDVSLGGGVQVLAGVVVQPATVIGSNTILNTSASVDHDCQVGAHVHVAPGATLSGGVVVGDLAHIGVGATVIQGVTIGERSVIGAGSVVVGDVAAGTTVVGVPAAPVGD